MTRYASNTNVSRARTIEEIESILMRYGAGGFGYGWEGSRAAIWFEACSRRVRFLVQMPSRGAEEFKLTPTGRKRTDDAALKEWEQACKQRWRALALVIKAKLEAVETGITEFEDEFMAQIVLPDGSTVADHTRPAIARAYETGKMQPMLPGPK